MLMDEPFSAVDPVVREQLQNEFLRLQEELGKTIVFVTHDIDEAIKLGDQVAVLRVGGQLAQLATPAELLARPGRRLRRRASSAATAATARSASPTAGDLPLDDEPTRRAGRRPSRRRRTARATAGCSSSTTHSQPQGWLAVGGAARRRAGRPTIAPDLLNLGGTLARERRHAARGARRRAVVAERARRRRRRGRSPARHRHRAERARASSRPRAAGRAAAGGGPAETRRERPS